MHRLTTGFLSVLALALASQPLVVAQEEVGKKRRGKIKIVWKELETKHYHIHYEEAITVATVTKVADSLEEALEQYVKFFKYDEFKKKKLKVRFLDSLNTYEQAGGDPSHPGFYNPRSDTLVLRQMEYWNLIPTAYHEAFHQYLRHYLGPGTPIPTWVNEGLAMYFEGMQINKKTKKLDYRLIDNRKIGSVKRAIFTRTALPFQKLIDAGHKEFHDKEHESKFYEQSFSVAYFLMKGMRGKPVFLFFKELKKTKDVNKAYEKLFGKKRKKMKAMERSWKAYTAKLELHDGKKGKV